MQFYLFSSIAGVLYRRLRQLLVKERALRRFCVRSVNKVGSKEAGEILHLSARQIKRLLKRYRKQDVAGWISKLYEGKSLLYNVFHKQTKQSEVVIAKYLNKAISTKSAPVLHKPTADRRWRTFQISTLG